MTRAEDWRPVIEEIARGYTNTRGGPPPYPIIEAQVDIESGGDPSTYDAGSGASGLGQIVKAGAEFQSYLENAGLVAKFGPNPDLFDPRTNLEIMIYGMDQRQESGLAERAAGRPGAYADWYMAAAGYLGGATQEGFNDAADSYGTTGQLYVRRIRQYILSHFKDKVAQNIDDLQPGSARAVSGGGGGDPWQDATASIVFDPNVKANPSHDWNANNVPDEYEQLYKEGYDEPDLPGTGVLDTAQQIGEIYSFIKAIPGYLDRLGQWMTANAPRAGFFVVGALLLALGGKMALS